MPKNMRHITNTMQDLKMLKMFFLKTLDKGKLNKIKEVNYDLEKQEIINIPGLFFNQTTKNFTYVTWTQSTYLL